MSEVVTKHPGDDYFGIALAVNNLSMMLDGHQQIARYVYDCMSKYAGPNHEAECVKMLVTMQEAIAALTVSGEREELAKKAEILANWFDAQNPQDKFIGTDQVQQDLRSMGSLLRAPVVVDDAMVERAKDSFHLPLTFDEISKYGTLEARIRRALNAALGGK